MKKRNIRMKFPKPALESAPTFDQLKNGTPGNESVMAMFFPESIDISHLELEVIDASGRVIGTIQYKGSGVLPLTDFVWTHIVEKDSLGELWKE